MKYLFEAKEITAANVLKAIDRQDIPEHEISVTIGSKLVMDQDTKILFDQALAQGDFNTIAALPIKSADYIEIDFGKHKLSTQDKAKLSELSEKLGYPNLTEVKISDEKTP